MNVAVVILNYNGESLLPDYLPSVIEFTPTDVRIYVVDNASTDQSLVYLQSLTSSIILIKLNENHGFAGGYNEGLKQIEADFYVLLNSDIEVTANWLPPLLQPIKNNHDIGAVVPKIKSHTTKDQFEYAGGSGGYLDKFGYAFCRGRIVDHVEKDTGQYDDEQLIAWGSGCALGIRASLYHGLGGFDQAFFAHFEEIDLCWRLRRTGYSIRCIPSSVVYHLGGGTLNYVSTRKLYLNFRNSLYMLYKNLNGWHCFKTIFIRMVLDGVAGLTYLAKGQFSSIAAIFKAHVSFYLSLSTLRKRSRKELSLINDLTIDKPRTDGEYKGSILWSFFVQKKKSFSELSEI